ncbi:hypothetical protein Taro_019980 [Colocasia esculenta]|uniref:Uncharacterized protein n=1 Tax=Colocasia esculenta TaxID=4460 RepID=A0A843UV82_COLES|nr:hypothetical protein [Colocasia esculenta]
MPRDHNPGSKTRLDRDWIGRVESVWARPIRSGVTQSVPASGSDRLGRITELGPIRRGSARIGPIRLKRLVFELALSSRWGALPNGQKRLVLALGGLGFLYKPPKGPHYAPNSSVEFSSPPTNFWASSLSHSGALLHYCEAISSFTLLLFIFGLSHTHSRPKLLAAIALPLSQPQKKSIYFLFVYYLTSFLCSKSWPPKVVLLRLPNLQATLPAPIPLGLIVPL